MKRLALAVAVAALTSLVGCTDEKSSRQTQTQPDPNPQIDTNPKQSSETGGSTTSNTGGTGNATGQAKPTTP